MLLERKSSEIIPQGNLKWKAVFLGCGGSEAEPWCQRALIALHVQGYNHIDFLPHDRNRALTQFDLYWTNAAHLPRTSALDIGAYVQTSACIVFSLRKKNLFLLLLLFYNFLSLLFSIFNTRSDWCILLCVYVLHFASRCVKFNYFNAVFIYVVYVVGEIQ